MVAKKENAPAPYHIMVRWLAMADIPEKNMFRSETIEEHIKTWIDLGYVIDTANHIGREQDEETGAVGEGIFMLFKYVG